MSYYIAGADSGIYIGEVGIPATNLTSLLLRYLVGTGSDLF